MITKEHGILGLVGICVVVLLLSFAGLASDFVTRLIGSIDGLLLFAICLMMLSLFAGMLFAMGREEGWIPSRHPAAGGPSAKPGPGPEQPAEGK